MTDVPSSALRIWAKAIDEIMIGALLFPAFGVSALSIFSGGPVWISWSFLVYLLVVPLLYEGLSVWLFGTTFGKWLFFLKIVHSKNPHSSLSAGQTFTRALAGRLSWFFSSAIQVMALFRYDRTHLADWLGKTRVVTTRVRPKQVVIHWIFGSIAFAIFISSGLLVAGAFLSSITYDSSGLSFFPIQP